MYELATGTVTIATTATGAATHRLYVGDEFVDTPINTGDTAIVIATAVVTLVLAVVETRLRAPDAADVRVGSAVFGARG